MYKLTSLHRQHKRHKYRLVQLHPHSSEPIMENFSDLRKNYEFLRDPEIQKHACVHIYIYIV